MVCELRKVLYGLKQFSNAQFFVFFKYIKSEGTLSGHSNHSLYQILCLRPPLSPLKKRERDDFGCIYRQCYIILTCDLEEKLIKLLKFCLREIEMKYEFCFSQYVSDRIESYYFLFKMNYTLDLLKKYEFLDISLQKFQ